VVWSSNEFCFVIAVDSFNEDVVETVADTANAGDSADLREALAIAN
jgi:hypothetical protein